VALLYQVANDKNIFDQVADLQAATGRKELEFYVKSIPIKRTIISKPKSVLNHWLARFGALRMSPKLDTLLVDDGFTYEVWFEAASNRAHFTLTDSHPNHGGYKTPLVRWMVSVLKSVQ
jgi:hypothetical protein